MPGVHLELTTSPEGRHLAFGEERRVVGHIFRRAGGATSPWMRLAVNARSPYTDADVFAPGTQLDYYVLHETPQGSQERRSYLASTIVERAASKST